MDQIKFICGSQDTTFKDHLPCNYVWDQEIQAKLTSHILNFYESLNSEKKAFKRIENVTYDDDNLIKFPSLLLYEKNEMVIMMSSRFAEWGKRAKENQKKKPFIVQSVEDELAMYLENDLDREEDVGEDLRNIEGSINSFLSGANKPKATNKPTKISEKVMLNIQFCEKCCKDVEHCSCASMISTENSSEG